MATRSRLVFWGWVVGVAGNLIWIVYAARTEAPGLAAQSMGFVLVNAFGAWKARQIKRRVTFRGLTK